MNLIYRDENGREIVLCPRHALKRRKKSGQPEQFMQAVATVRKGTCADCAALDKTEPKRHNILHRFR